MENSKSVRKSIYMDRQLADVIKDYCEMTQTNFSAFMTEAAEKFLLDKNTFDGKDALFEVEVGKLDFSDDREPYELLRFYGVKLFGVDNEIIIDINKIIERVTLYKTRKNKYLLHFLREDLEEGGIRQLSILGNEGSVEIYDCIDDLLMDIKNRRIELPNSMINFIQKLEAPVRDLDV